MKGKHKETWPVFRNWPSLAAALVLVLLCACASPTTAPLPTPRLVPAPSPTFRATAAPTRTATAAPATQTPAPAPTVRLEPTITQIAKGFGAPDDLALLPDGSILFSDLANGSVNEIRPDGKIVTLLRGLDEPEGIVVLSDGSLVIAEQGKNRLLQWRPNAGPPTVWLQLENRTGKAGVDGIARDPATGDIIVPDSPNGRVLRVSPTKRIRVIATGLVRPTGVAVADDGSIIVADEYGNSVKRIRNGVVEILGRFATPDDVAMDAQGNIYVACLGDNSLRMLDARSGAIRLIASTPSPQGLLIDPTGGLIVALSATNRIVRVSK